MKNKKGHYSYWANALELPLYSKKLKYWGEMSYLAMLKEAITTIEGISLLEIGPGKGYFAEKAIEREIDYYSIERSEILVEELLRKNINVIRGDASIVDENIFKDKKFDAVYLSHVIEHCDTRKEVENLIKKCRGWLKPNGYIMINAPNVLSYKFDFWISDYTHNFVTTPLRVKNLLLDNEFEPLYEQRTVFGLRNIILRKFAGCLFFLCPNAILDRIGRIFMPKGGEAGFSIYGHENFTIIAKRMEK